MEKETIIDLYYGRLNPMDMEIEGKEAYELHCRKAAEEIKAFRNELTEDLRERFDRLWDDEMQADEILYRDAFIKGFQLGLKLTAEALG